MKLAWLLIIHLYHLDATSPIITVPGIGSQGECYTLAQKIKGNNSDVRCIAYEVSN